VDFTFGLARSASETSIDESAFRSQSAASDPTAADNNAVINDQSIAIIIEPPRDSPSILVDEGQIAANLAAGNFAVDNTSN